MAICSERLTADLCSPDETTRRYAVEELGDCEDQTAVELLIRALADPSAAVREAALDSLERIGGEAVVQAALPALRSQHVPLRNAACFLLGQLGETAVEHLAEIATDGEKDVRLFAIDTLARIGSHSAEAAIIPALQDLDINVAAAAAAALGEVGTASAVVPLIAVLTSDSWVRCAVAKSLGQIGNLDAVQALTELAQDEDTLVAYAATKALTEADAGRNPRNGTLGEGAELR
ncbi:MAG: HEAT repeat domain-containing protein [Pirellulaceae bacterium]